MVNPDDLNPYQSPHLHEDPGLNAIPLEPFEDDLQQGLDDPVVLTTFAHSAEAEVRRIWLEEHGIRAVLTDSGMVSAAFLLSNALGGVKLIVARRDARRAVELWHNQDAIEQARAKIAENLPPIVFRCEECSAEISFPSHRRGKVETCPRCREYVDVPS